MRVQGISTNDKYVHILVARKESEIISKTIMVFDETWVAQTT
jgi:hypothetical protein